jgi:hypothetical protein
MSDGLHPPLLSLPVSLALALRDFSGRSLLNVLSQIVCEGLARIVPVSEIHL